MVFRWFSAAVLRRGVVGEKARRCFSLAVFRLGGFSIESRSGKEAGEREGEKESESEREKGTGEVEGAVSWLLIENMERKSSIASGKLRKQGGWAVLRCCRVSVVRQAGS